MAKKTNEEIDRFINKILESYYKTRLGNISKKKFRDVFKYKNPYLLAANGYNEIHVLVDDLLAQQIKTSDETIFGNLFFEPLAQFASNAEKSGITGVDLEIRNDEIINLISVKSGIKIFNASSKLKQSEYFNSARKILKPSGKVVSAIVGYCYGKKNLNKSGNYSFHELAGNEFWEMLTGDPELYVFIVKSIEGNTSKLLAELNQEIERTRARWIKEAEEILETDASGKINWESVVRSFCFNSSKKDASRRLEEAARKLQVTKPKRSTKDKEVKKEG